MDFNTLNTLLFAFMLLLTSALLFVLGYFIYLCIKLMGKLKQIEYHEGIISQEKENAMKRVIVRQPPEPRAMQD